MPMICRTTIIDGKLIVDKPNYAGTFIDGVRLGRVIASEQCPFCGRKLKNNPPLCKCSAWIKFEEFLCPPIRCENSSNNQEFTITCKYCLTTFTASFEIEEGKESIHTVYCPCKASYMVCYMPATEIVKEPEDDQTIADDAKVLRDDYPIELVDAELRADGLDPDAVAEEGERFVSDLVNRSNGGTP